MAKDWEYSILSSDVAIAGGRKAYDAMIKQQGRLEGRTEMIPYIGLAMLGSSAITALIAKLNNDHKKKIELNKLIHNVEKEPKKADSSFANKRIYKEDENESKTL